MYNIKFVKSAYKKLSQALKQTFNWQSIHFYKNIDEHGYGRAKS